MQCLASGAHLYIEKPFALNYEETRQLLDCAESKRLKITAGHDLQFSPVARRMRGLIQTGYLGGAPVHMESYYCYELGNPTYARALLANSGHWVRQLPGKLLQNVISHGMARLAEYFEGDDPDVQVCGYVSPMLRSLGEEEIVDELRVMVSEGRQRSAYFTFSSQMQPALNQFRIFGPANGLVLDQDQETLLRLPGRRFKSYAQKFIPPVVTAKECISNVATNLRLLLRREFQPKAGMHWLISSFYNAIANNTPPPIPAREILWTARVMDKIFAQLHRGGDWGELHKIHDEIP
jgi:predicted dehydrogenase